MLRTARCGMQLRISCSGPGGGATKPMKVLLYSQTFFPSTGGVQTVVLELGYGLAKWYNGTTGCERFDVTVVTDTAGTPEQDHCVPFCVVRQPRFWKLVRLVRDADVVHLAGPALMPLSLALLLRKPLVIEHHGFQTICPNGQLLYEPDETPCPGHFMARRFGECVRCNAKTMGLWQSIRALLLTPVRRWLSNQVSVNITPTDWLATRLKLRRSKTVLHGISRALRGDSKPASISTFAYQGRLVSTKGVRLLLQAFQRLCLDRRGLRLRIIGTGPQEQLLRSEAAKLNGSVEFLDHVPDEELDQALSDAATVVMPSLAGEVFGLVALENMLRGKLLVVSDFGALREVVGETGFVFPAGDTSSLAACMREALDDPPRAFALGQAARARALQVFGSRRMIQEHVALYREVSLLKRRAG
jgi:glycogen synthase